MNPWIDLLFIIGLALIAAASTMNLVEYAYYFFTGKTLKTNEAINGVWWIASILLLIKIILIVT